jgi:hypothetical protein
VNPNAAVARTTETTENLQDSRTTIGHVMPLGRKTAHRAVPILLKEELSIKTNEAMERCMPIHLNNLR